MELISVRELYKNTAKYADQTIEIGGWVRNRRPSKQFGFIMLNDGTYFRNLQIILEADRLPDYARTVKAITTGAVEMSLQEMQLVEGEEVPYPEDTITGVMLIVIVVADSLAQRRSIEMARRKRLLSRTAENPEEA